MNCNISEILVANGTGIGLIVMLCLSRIKFHKTRTVREGLFHTMLAVTLIATIAETIGFLLDVKMFPFCHVILLVVNAICIGSTVIVGFIWCIYTDMRIHRNPHVLHKLKWMFGAPLAVVSVMLVMDLFGANLLFAITSENVYERGPLAPLVYIILFAYFTHSLAITFRFRNKLPHVQFFPVMFFVLPCIVGTIIQGMFYGIAIGWLAVAIAFVFVQMNYLNENSYIDNMSGLYNRNYLNYILQLFERKRYENTYGIMMDVNGFKSINDTLGHAVGDEAIQSIGSLLIDFASISTFVIRTGGDEFIILLTNSSKEAVEKTVSQIKARIAEFNETDNRPYTLSLSFGCACYAGGSAADFMSDMDRELYRNKSEYYQSVSD